MWKIIRRGLLLVLLGLIYNGLFRLEFETLRFPSVLGRIGLAWMFAALIFLYCGVRVRIAIVTVILIGYGVLVQFVGAPDAAGAKPLSLAGNIVGYIDRMVMPSHLLEEGFDPEGLLSTVPAIATALLGMFAGEFVRLPEECLPGSRKTLYMALAAVAFLIVGVCWNEILPINKKLWTSSFVCTVAAYSLGLFALFYYLIDVKQYRRWTLFFQVIGVNSIAIYMAQRIVRFGTISQFFVGGLAGKASEPVAAVISAVGYVAVCWLFLYFLYRKRVFLKV